MLRFPLLGLMCLCSPLSHAVKTNTRPVHNVLLKKKKKNDAEGRLSLSQKLVVSTNTPVCIPFLMSGMQYCILLYRLRTDILATHPLITFINRFSVVSIVLP